MRVPPRFHCCLHRYCDGKLDPTEAALCQEFGAALGLTAGRSAAIVGAVQQSRQASEALQERHAAVPAVKRNRSNAWDLEKSNDFFPVLATLLAPAQ